MDGALEEAIVIGGGIIGLACARELQCRGVGVTLIDRDEPARGCSFGNAGIIAASDVLPIISPAHMRSLPRMLVAREGPVRVEAAAMPALLPWFLRAALTLGSGRQARISSAIASLNALAVSAWRPLLAACGGSHLLAERGMLELARGPAASTLPARADHLRALGQPVSLVEGSAIREMEPGLSAKATTALFHEGNAHVRDPFEVASALYQAFRAAGGKWVQDEVLQLLPGDGATSVSTRGRNYRAQQVIVSAGFRSRDLLGALGLKIPLQIERGYHLELRGLSGLTQRPLAFAAESFVATPMANGLRLAGTVEFARAASPPDWRRAEMLRRQASSYFTLSLADAESSRWTGDRPSFPDSLPAVGRFGREPILYAFGHQHLGLTQAAVTAQIIAGLVLDAPPPVDIRPYSLDRFR